MKIAFVACNKNPRKFREDPSFRYRCENLGASLAEAGHRVGFFHLSRYLPARDGDVTVFHRPSDSWRLKLALLLCKRSRVFPIADLDDRIFDLELAPFSPGVINGLVSLKWTRQRFAAHRRALALFPAITSSTEPLALALRECYPTARTAVIPNAVPPAWVHQAKPPIETNRREWTLAYNPGTRSHDRDFAMISGVLDSVMERHPRLHLTVTGPLRLDSIRSRERVRHRAKVPFEHYDEVARTGWLNLCPLEDTPFNRCKSALKVIEAAYWDIPTLTSPLADAARFHEAGAVTCDQPRDWAEAIETLLGSPERYRLLAEGLRGRVLEIAGPRRIAEQWLTFVGNQPDVKRP